MSHFKFAVLKLRCFVVVIAAVDLDLLASVECSALRIRAKIYNLVNHMKVCACVFVRVLYVRARVRFLFYFASCRGSE